MSQIKDLNDEALIALVFQGDSAALKEILHRYNHKIINYMKRLLGGGAVRAEDMAQIVWLRVIQSADKYQNRGRFQYWLYAIARNTVSNERRSAYSRYESATEDVEVTEMMNREGTLEKRSMEDELFDRESLRAIAEAVDELPESQRAVFVAYMTEDLSLKDLAKELGMTMQTLTSLIFRARRNLEKRLKKRSPADE